MVGSLPANAGDAGSSPGLGGEKKQRDKYRKAETKK